MAMMRSKKENIKRENKVKYCRCVVTVLQVVAFCQNVSNIAAQDYLQSNEHTQESSHSSEIFSNQGLKYGSHNLPLDEINVLTLVDRIKFDPPFLDFGPQPVGIPVTSLVYLYNPSETQSLKLVSISARTSHFHSSFFGEKVVFSKCNTSFEVVFLARTIGNVENTLFINTAIGSFSYQVFGVGIPNPYRLRPYLGAKVSLNSTFSPLISMHNPTSTPLQVTEVYTSSGFLHLQLPTGHHESSLAAWEIPPYETRPLMQASFLGQVADNHTAYIRIKTNLSDATQYLILPVEVEVSSAPGIYSSLDVLDFGTLRSRDEPKALNLFLLNSGKKEVQVSSIQAQPENSALSIDFKPLKLKPSEAVYTRVANVSFDVRHVTSETQWSGKIVIRTKEKSYPKISIPYQANVLNGTLGFNETDTFFQIPTSMASKLAPIRRRFSLTNTFDFPVVLHRLELTEEASVFYKIEDFTSPVLLPTQGSAYCFTLLCDPRSLQSKRRHGDEHISIVHQLILHTNVSSFSLPLQIFTGFLKFKVELGNANDLDFGITGTGDRRTLLLQVFNHNPLPISLLDCNSSVVGVGIRFLSLTRNEEEISPPSINNHFPKIVLPPDSCITFQVELVAPDVETILNGSLNLFTKFEILKIAVRAKVAVGAILIKPSQIRFAPTFPGMIVHQSISVTSTFSQTTKIDSITSLDKRFYYRKLKNVAGELNPSREVRIGKLYFDARQDCKPDRCYVGLPTSTTVGHHWLTTLNLGKEAPDLDTKLYKTLRGRWMALKDANATSLNGTFKLSTNLLRDLDVITHASLYWPTLVDLEEPVYKFPLTHMTKETVKEIVLHNPSNLPIIFQILPISIYPQPETVLDTLGLAHLLERDGFTVTNQKTFAIAMPPNSSTQDTTSQTVWLDYKLNGKANRSCLNLFLNPGQTQNIQITFSPQGDAKSSTVILFRNNLTVLEALLVQGTGVKEELKLGGKLSNKKESLRFKLTESLLRDCLPENRRASPSFTVRKSFTAKNLGLLPLNVICTMVDNYPCEGYGFRVLDCERYVLEPNATRDVIIAFTPDFTTSQVHRTLRIVTQQGNLLTFNLNVTLPYRMLPSCQAAIPRPSWEESLYYIVVFLMLALFLGTILAAYLESQNIWDSFGVTSSGKLKPFSLQPIATHYMSNYSEPEQNKSPKRRKPVGITAISHRSEGWSARFQSCLRNFASYDLIGIFKSRRRTDGPNALEKVIFERKDDPENNFEPETLPPSVNAEVLQRLSVASVTASCSKVRQRKTRSSQSNPWRDRRGSKSSRNFEFKAEEKEEVPWSPPEPLDFQKKKIAVASVTPTESRNSRSSSSARISSSSGSGSSGNSSGCPSVESSRSRGSSVSSNAGEVDKTTDRKQEGKRKRVATFVRQHRTSHENDETSSTTTERSNEDIDYNEKHAQEQHISRTNRSPSKWNKSKSRERPQVNSDTPSYSTADESEGIRKRRTRTNLVKQTKSTAPKLLTKSKSTLTSSVTYYDTTSSTDEPIFWEDPKPKFDNRDVDQRMKALAENTRRVDSRMRAKSVPAKIQKISPGLNKNADGSGPLSINLNDKTEITSVPKITSHQRKKKPSLLKTNSDPMTDHSFAMMSSPTGNAIHPPTLDGARQLSMSAKQPFSIFSTPGCSDSEMTRPEYPSNGWMQEWNNFGSNSFSITQGLMPSMTSPMPSTASQSIWSEPSMFTAPVTSSNWTGPSQMMQASRPLPGSPTLSPEVNSRGGALASCRFSPPTVARSTHQIWSVSNAVTMDEDRNTGEVDPLGLKRIWSSDHYLQQNDVDQNPGSFF